MDDEPRDAGAEGASAEGRDAAPDVGFARTLLQFFVIPALVVAVCVGIFFFFSWAVSEEKTAVDYLHDIRTGSAGRRWQAAFELAKILNHPSEKDRLAGLAPEMIDTFREAKEDDPRVRRYLALALGRLGDRQAVPALVEALDDDDGETRLYAAWALGALGDRRAVEPLTRLAASDDPGVRKMAVYGLGVLGAPEARQTLEAALDDPHIDVAFNAAVALARLGDGAGRGRLLQMLDRSFLETVAEMSPDQKAQAMIAAIQSAVLLGDEELRARLEEIARSEPNLKVRQAALEALRELDKRVRTSPPSGS